VADFDDAHLIVLLKDIQASMHEIIRCQAAMIACFDRMEIMHHRSHALREHIMSTWERPAESIRKLAGLPAELGGLPDATGAPLEGTRAPIGRDGAPRPGKQVRRGSVRRRKAVRST
jgi:hypothetical protein